MAKRKKYSPEFKAKVVLELIQGDQPISVVASKYDLNPNLLSGWRKQFLDKASEVFSEEQTKAEAARVASEHESEVDNLNRIIGELTVERDYLQRRVREVIGRDEGPRSRG